MIIHNNTFSLYLNNITSHVIGITPLLCYLNNITSCYLNNTHSCYLNDTPFTLFNNTTLCYLNNTHSCYLNKTSYYLNNTLFT